MDFASALREATGTALAGTPALQALRTSLAAPAPAAGARAEAHLRYATPSQTNLDRNTVDMDRERASFADNTREVRGHAALHQRAACARCSTRCKSRQQG